MIHLQVERNFLLMSIAYAANIGTNFAWIFEYILVQMFVLANIGGNVGANIVMVLNQHC